MLLTVLLTLLTNAQGGLLNVFNRSGEETFSCDSSDDTCNIYSTAFCDSGCTTTFNCPNETCTECIIDCDGERACQDSIINSFDCDVVQVNALSGFLTLYRAVINGPVKGDLHINASSSDYRALQSAGAEIYGPSEGNVYVNVFGTDGYTLASATIYGATQGNMYVNVFGTSSSTLRSSTINGPTTGNMYLNVLETGGHTFDQATINGPNDGNMYVNILGTAENILYQATINGATIATGNLELHCEGDCQDSNINCPRNSTSGGPSCFIYCTGTGSGCADMEIDSVSGTPLDVKIFCEPSEANLCDGTKIDCDANAPCTMEYIDGEWRCSDTACNNPTGSPTVLPSSEPSEIPSSEPSEIPSSEPSEIPSMQPTLMPSDPSLMPSFEPSIPSPEPTTVPSMPSAQPTAVASTKAPSSLPTDSSGATASTAISGADGVDGADGGTDKDNDEGLSGGMIAVIVVSSLVGLFGLAVIVAYCVSRSKRKRDDASTMEENIRRDDETEATSEKQSKEQVDPTTTSTSNDTQKKVVNTGGVGEENPLELASGHDEQPREEVMMYVTEGEGHKATTAEEGEGSRRGSEDNVTNM